MFGIYTTILTIKQCSTQKIDSIDYFYLRDGLDLRFWTVYVSVIADNMS
jgi:hypothetical protein